MKILPCILASLLLAVPAVANINPGWGLSIDDISDDFAKISWGAAPDGCPPSERWVIQLQVPQTPGGPPVKWTTLGSQVQFDTSYKVENLVAESNYAVRVYFDGAASQARTFTTRGAFVGGVHATVVNLDDLDVTWLAQAGADGYYLEYFVGNLKTVVSLAGNRTSFSVDDLVDQQPVTVRIYATLPGGDRTGWAEDGSHTGLPNPSPFTVRPIGEGPFMDLAWTRVDFVPNGYRIERSAWDNQSYGFLTQEPPSIDLSYDDLSADPGTKYFYRIRAEVTALQVSSWVETCGWTKAPPAPANLIALAVTEASITLTWDEIQGIPQYAIERAASPFTFWEEVGTSPSNEFIDGLATDFPLFPGNTYRYRVRGQTLDQWAGDTGNSLTTDVTTPAANPGPLNAVLSGTGSTINLSWTNVFGETGYRLEKRSATLGGDFGSWALRSNPSAGSSSTADISISGGMRHQYRIRSTNGAGNSSWAESAEVSTTAGVPTNVLASPGSGPGANDCDDAITVTWGQVAGATGYVVRRSLVNMTQAVEFVINGGATTTFTDTGLDPYVTYLYLVKSTSAGPDSAYGVFRYELTCLSLVASPSGQTVNLSWTELASPFSEYRIERRDVDGGGSFEEIATGGI